MDNYRYIAYYTTPKGFHRSKSYSTFSAAMAHKGRVWCVTCSVFLSGVLRSTALYVNMSKY